MISQKTLDEIEKTFGEGAVMLYGKTPKTEIDVVPTGLPAVDAALGVGGLALGRVVEIYGKEAGGKSTLALHIMAEAQKEGMQVAYMDMEYTLDPIYATKLGVNMDDVIVSQPESAEKTLELIETLAKTGEVSVIVVDSLAAMATQAQIDSEMGDVQVAGLPRLMSRALPKLSPILSQNNCLLIFINQLRDIIGGFGYGPSEQTPGGRALKFAASVRIDVRRIKSLKQGEKVYGHLAKIKITKNKLSPPHKEADVEIIYGEGFSKESDVLEAALEKGVIIKKGGWFAFDGVNFAQGKPAAREALKDKDFFNSVITKMKEGE